MAKKDYLDLLADALVAKGTSMGRELDMIYIVSHLQINAPEHLAQYEQALINLWADGLSGNWPWTDFGGVQDGKRKGG